MPVKKMTQLARNNRNNATLEEKRLWNQLLSTYPLRFHRQKVIGPYIADFYCHEAKLVIELDGSQHYQDENTAKDELRTQYLNAQGIRVLRFTNHEVYRYFDAVCETINQVIEEIIGHELDCGER